MPLGSAPISIGVGPRLEALYFFLQHREGQLLSVFPLFLLPFYIQNAENTSDEKHLPLFHSNVWITRTIAVVVIHGILGGEIIKRRRCLK